MNARGVVGQPAKVLWSWPNFDPALTHSAVACAGSDQKQQGHGDGITYTVEWQVQTMPSPAAAVSLRPSACRPGVASWQLSVPGREPQTMRIRGSSADTAHAAIASLGQLQTAFAQLGPVSTALQLTMYGAVVTSPGAPSSASCSMARPQPAAHAALLGLGKVAALEMLSVACAAQDLDIRAVQHPSGPAPAGSAAGGDAHGIALRCGACLAPRLLPAPAAAPALGHGLPSMGLTSLEGAATQPGTKTRSCMF